MRPPRPSRGVPIVLASLLIVAAAAPTAGAERAAPVGAGLTGELASITPDGSVVTTSNGEDQPTLGVASLAGDGTFSRTKDFGYTGGAITRTATAPDGSAVLVSPIGDNSRLGLSLRSPGGAFGPLAPLGNDRVSASSAALGGGVVLVGSSVQIDRPGDGFSTQPVVLRRAADGTVAPPIVLPGGPNAGDHDGDVQVGLDASGRGVVAWTRGTGAASRVDVATIAADGTVGPPTELPGRSPDSTNDTGVLVRVAADGTGAVAWPTGDTVSVAPVSTTAAPDLTRTASVKLARAKIQLQADGAALVSDVRSKGGRSLYVASRAAGRPFTAVERVRDVRGTFQASALSGGTWVATQKGGGDGYPSVAKASVVHGRAGGTPSKAIPVPVGAATSADLSAAATNGRPLVLVSSLRAVYAVPDRDEAYVRRTQAFRPAAGQKIPAGTSVRLARSQRLGRAGAVRMTIRCSSACSYRVASETLEDGRATGDFDVCRIMGRGTRSVAIPYGGSSTSENAPVRPLRRAQRVRFTIAVDDARGGESVLQRSVTVRP